MTADLYPLVIGGQLQNGRGEDLTHVRHRYDGRLLATVRGADRQQVEEAVAVAVTAGRSLSRASAGQRAAWLHRLGDLLGEHRSELIQALIGGAGKPLDYAGVEWQRCVDTLRMTAAEILRFGGEYVPVDYGPGEGRQGLALRVPVGPVLGIVPYNFPINLAMHKLAPALATGCPVILKPSPLAPLPTLMLARLACEAGFPPGSVSALLAENDLLADLADDPRLPMLSFTGSPAVGWNLRQLWWRKKTTLELGGNAAVLIDRHTSPESIAGILAGGACLYAGQICISTQRIYLVDDDPAPWFGALTRAFQAVQSGDPARAGVVDGPLISAEQLQRVAAMVGAATEAGARVLAGAEVLSEEQRIYAPTLLTGTERSMDVVQEEVFGPVAVVESVPDFSTGLAMINDSCYGLQAGVFTRDLERMKEAHATLEVGAVIMNQVPGFRVDSMPYGGVKQSGSGREGVRYAMEDMTEPRLLVY